MGHSLSLPSQICQGSMRYEERGKGSACLSLCVCEGGGGGSWDKKVGSDPSRPESQPGSLRLQRRVLVRLALPPQPIGGFACTSGARPTWWGVAAGPVPVAGRPFSRSVSQLKSLNVLVV